MTDANVAGLMRLPLSLCASACLIIPMPAGRAVAAGFLVLAVATDVLDGWLARRQGTVSVFGAFLDMTMDKILACPLLFLTGNSDPWLLAMATLITVREFLVMGIRAFCGAKGVVIVAMPLGKLKSIVLFPGLFCLLIGWSIGFWIIVVATVLSVVSCVDYVRRAWGPIREGLDGG